MKRLLLILLLLLLPGVSFAERVSLEKAMRIAANFCSGSIATKAAPSLQFVAGGDEYFVFQRSDGGFVIISGDDAAVPVLGYSSTGKFKADGLPANCKAWLEGYKAQIQYLRNSGAGRSTKAKALWDELLVSTKAGEGGYESQLLLTTANWSQGDPYNLFCPVIDSTRCLTGCVATAASIVARYYNYPKHCSGTIPGYSFVYKDKHYSVPDHDLPSDGYDWDYMPMTPSAITTDREKTAIAELMYDMGTIAKAMYGLDATGAYTYILHNGMINYLGFDSHAQYLFRRDYADSVWVDMLKRDLNETGPILYAGSSEEEGHQFVLAGYDAKDNFYINWGWGGSMNGYFAIDAFVMGGQSSYIYNQDAILGMKPAGYDPQEGDLDEITTLDFDPATRTVTVETFRDASYTFTDSSGKAVTKGVSKEGRKIIIKSENYKADTYVLTLSKGGQTKVVELILGR